MANKRVGVSTSIFVSMHIAGVLLVLVMLYVILPKFDFVTDNYTAWMHVGAATALLSAFFKIIGKVFPIMFHLMEALAGIAGVYSMMLFVSLVPFDFSLIGIHILNTLLKMAMTIAIAVTSISIVVSLVRFPISLLSKPKE